MYTRGFTLIELLVVIAIIGMLASIVLVSLGTARAAGRDAKRKGDIHAIENALNLYWDTHYSYPSTGATNPSRVSLSSGSWTGSWSGALTALQNENDIAVLPIDPTNANGPWFNCLASCGVSSYYFYMSDGVHYILGAWLENHNDRNVLIKSDIPNPWNNNEMLRANYNYGDYLYVKTDTNP